MGPLTFELYNTNVPTALAECVYIRPRTIVIRMFIISIHWIIHSTIFKYRIHYFILFL